MKTKLVFVLCVIVVTIMQAMPREVSGRSLGKGVLVPEERDAKREIGCILEGLSSVTVAPMLSEAQVPEEMPLHVIVRKLAYSMRGLSVAENADFMQRLRQEAGQSQHIDIEAAREILVSVVDSPWFRLAPEVGSARCIPVAHSRLKRVRSVPSELNMLVVLRHE
jgi:hypothetical protein